jgi:hypothetical protein
MIPIVFIGVPLGVFTGVCTRLWFWLSLVVTEGAAAVHPLVVMAAPRMSRTKKRKKPIFIELCMTTSALYFSFHTVPAVCIRPVAPVFTRNIIAGDLNHTYD